MQAKLPWTSNIANGLLTGVFFYVLENQYFMWAMVVLLLLLGSITVEIILLQRIVSSPTAASNVGSARVDWREGVPAIGGLAFSLLFASILALVSYAVLFLILPYLPSPQPAPAPGSDAPASWGNSIAICVGLWFLVPLIAGNFGSWLGFRAAIAQYAGNPTVRMVLGVLISAVLAPGCCCLFAVAVFKLGTAPQAPQAGEPLPYSARGWLTLFALLPAVISTGVQFFLVLAKRF